MNSHPIPYIFNELDSDKSFQELAAVLDSTLKDNVITIGGSMGTGSIRKMPVEDGLYLRGWDLCLRQPFVLDKRNDCLPPEKFFHLIYVLNPEAVTLTMLSSCVSFRLQKGMNVLFVSGDVYFQAEIDGGQELKALDVSFTSGWLERTFDDRSGALQTFIDNLLQSTSPVLFFESTSPADYLVLRKAHATILSGLRDNLKIKSGILTLLSCFFHSVPQKKPDEVISNQFMYRDKMLKVEEFLLAHIQKKLPHIETIARSVAMSESSLKRHFKKMFGQCIYDHYLQLKMEHAKKILLQQQLSVSELAALLDYEKVSSFIDMFKRHFGVSPGAMQHRA